MRSRAGLVTEILVFATEISVTGVKMSHINTSARMTRTRCFCQKVHFCNITAKMALFFVLCALPLQKYSNYLKVTRVHKTTLVANVSSLCSTIFFFLNFIPVDRAEISHRTHNKILPGTGSPSSLYEPHRQHNMASNYTGLYGIFYKISMEVVESCLPYSIRVLFIPGVVILPI